MLKNLLCLPHIFSLSGVEVDIVCDIMRPPLNDLCEITQV